jgi:cation transport regulator ChaC
MQTHIPMESTFYYFAYGSCMCPVDLKRTLGENANPYVIGAATLKGYRMGFYHLSLRRNCGVSDVAPDINFCVEGVLYRLPSRLSELLDQREGVSRGSYRREIVNVFCQGQLHTNVRTYVSVRRLTEELAPNDWYSDVVLRGAQACGLSQEYWWWLFNHIYQLQQGHYQNKGKMRKF